MKNMNIRGVMVKTINVALSELGITAAFCGISTVKLANEEDKPGTADISIDSEGFVYLNYDTPPTSECEQKIRELLK